jgi:hypothetical protein
VLEGVIVAEAVIVGVAEINGVGVGVEEVVGVGIVRVGKGFRSESAVAAMAVFVPLASFCVPPSPEAVMSLNVTTYTTKIRPIQSKACNKICRGSRFSFFTMSAFLISLDSEGRRVGWSVDLFGSMRVRSQTTSQGAF